MYFVEIKTWKMIFVIMVYYLNTCEYKKDAQKAFPSPLSSSGCGAQHKVVGERSSI